MERTNFAPANVDNWNGNASIVGKSLHTPNGFAFVSEPFKSPVELSGLFSGRLDFITNKKDFDFNVQLYQLQPDGEYLQLSYYWARASYVKDRGRRELLIPGKRQQLDFESNLLTSRQFATGSRLVVVLSIIKRSDAQINYGTGKDVSDETIADAKEPLHIKWFDDSFVAIPVLMTR
jgi:predicted acyl esterase